MNLHLYVVEGFIAKEVSERAQEYEALHSGHAALNQTKEWKTQGLQ